MAWIVVSDGRSKQRRDSSVILLSAGLEQPVLRVTTGEAITALGRVDKRDAGRGGQALQSLVREFVGIVVHDWARLERLQARHHPNTQWP